MESEEPLDVRCIPRVVNYHNGECLVSGKKIPKMKHSLEICQSYYQSFAQSICVSMEGLEELEKLINEDFFIKNMSSIEIKGKAPKSSKKCFLCSCEESVMQFNSENGREIMTICRDCLEDKITTGKKKLKAAEDKTLHYNSSGFVIQGTERIKEVQNVVTGDLSHNSSMCITFGTYRKSNKKHFRIEDIERLIEILGSTETSGKATCGLCDARGEYLSLPLSEEGLHLSIRICDKCRSSVKEELEKFLENNHSNVISSII